MSFVGNFKARSQVIGELLSFLWKRRLWWLLPMVATLVLFGLLLTFAQGSALAPFIYSIV